MKTNKQARFAISCIALLVSAAAAQATTTIGVTPASISFSYTKGGAMPTTNNKVAIAPVGAATTTTPMYFTIDPTTMPSWLQADKMNGNATSATPVNVTFTPSPVASSNPVGTYAATVSVLSSGLTTATITVTMTLLNAPPTLTATLSYSPNAAWTTGSTKPSGILTVTSSGDVTGFTITTAATNPSSPWITMGQTSGFATSWGTPIPVTFSQFAFDNATVGVPLTGTITIKASQGATSPAPIAVSISVSAGGATVTSVSPARLPQVITSGTSRTIAVKGTNFAPGMPVGIGTAHTAVPSACATFTTASSDAWCYQNSTEFFLRLSAATLATASGTSNQLALYLNAGGSGSLNIPVVTTPIVNAVTDAAGFIVPSGTGSAANLNVAPYQLVSIFGDNFSSPSAAIAVASGRFPNSLTDGSSNALKVSFTLADGTTALDHDSDAYLLLWTPSQINLLIPSSLPAAASGGELEAFVTVGSASSPAIVFNVVGANPNLFAFSAGAGQGVILNADGSVNSSTNAAKFGSIVVLYVSGMGVPAGGSADISSGPAASLGTFPAGCATPDSFLAAENTANTSTWTTLDGSLIASSIFTANNALAPCFDPASVTAPLSVTMGTNAKTLPAGAVKWAGWVADTVAGLYQVNVQIPLSTDSSLSGLLPAAATTAAAYPIVLGVGSAHTQPGVVLYVSK